MFPSRPRALSGIRPRIGQDPCQRPMDHGAPDDDGDNGVPDLRRFFSTGLPLPWGPSSSAVVVSAVVTAVETTGTGMININNYCTAPRPRLTRKEGGNEKQSMGSGTSRTSRTSGGPIGE